MKRCLIHYLVLCHDFPFVYKFKEFQATYSAKSKTESLTSVREPRPSTHSETGKNLVGPLGPPIGHQHATTDNLTLCQGLL